jgi:hypothetical protein
MPWGAAAVAGATIVGSVISSNASKSAANTQADAANNATNQQRAMMERQIELNKPYYDVGVSALNRLNEQAPFDPNAFNYQADPGYAFRLSEGNKALNASAAARGGMISGNALKAAQTYGQNMGSQEYANAYNRYVQGYGINNSNNQFLANLGQSSANNQANALGNFGNAYAANTIGAGNAQAAGQIGSANAYTNAISQGIGQYNYNNLLNRFGGSQSAYGDVGTRSGGAANVYDYSTPYNPNQG